MKRIAQLSLIMLLFVGLQDAQAQDVKKFLEKRKGAAKGAATERAGREADRGIRKGVNKGLDKIFGEEETPSQAQENQAPSTSSSSSSSSSAGSEIGMKALMGAMGISTGTANVKPVYAFDGFIEMTITNFENGKQEDESVVYKTFIDSRTFDYGMEFSQEEEEGVSLIIFDSENNLMLTLSESNGEKTGFAMSFDPTETYAEELEDEEELEEVSDPYLQYKTGKTKNILGYKCHEYRIENEDDDVITMWITNDMDKEMKKTYLQNSTFTGLFTYAYYTNGMVMEYIIEDASANEKSVMTVTDIDLSKNNTISTQGYMIMNMSDAMEAAEEEGEEDDE
jgi:hypothetical protein